MTPAVLEMVKALRKRVFIGVVGGSDFEKQKEQLGDNVLELFDYSFPENGLIGFKQGKQFHSKSIKDYLGEEKLKEFLKWTLHYIADLDIPKKRGTFVEFRTGMLNVCPIGRNCTHEERLEFFDYDNKHKVREEMVKLMDEKFGKSYGLKFSIGGQISIDVFPIGWDKTYCLQHVKEFKEIHFFGDKTMPGGNDYEIFTHPDVKGHTVTAPEDTVKQVTELFLQ